MIFMLVCAISYLRELIDGRIAGITVGELINVACELFFFVFHYEEHVSGESINVSCRKIILVIDKYLGSNGRRKSGIPASRSFCLTHSSSQDGRMMCCSPLFSNEATLTVPRRI